MSVIGMSNSQTGWFILKFEEPARNLQKTILYQNDRAQPLDEAATGLADTVFREFTLLGDMSNEDVYTISLSVLTTNPHTEPVITFFQLVAYLRDLPGGLVATTPDLFGLSDSKVQVQFEYIDELDD